MPPAWIIIIIVLFFAGGLVDVLLVLRDAKISRATEKKKISFE
jgi:hypothetical protein